MFELNRKLTYNKLIKCKYYAEALKGNNYKELGFLGYNSVNNLVFNKNRFICAKLLSEHIFSIEVLKFKLTPSGIQTSEYKNVLNSFSNIDNVGVGLDDVDIIIDSLPSISLLYFARLYI